MTQQALYRISFINHGKLFELYARRVEAAELYGFTAVSELVFGDGNQVVVDPTEERLREEFGQTEQLLLPMHCIVRIERVRRQSAARIRDAATGEKVTPFPLPPRQRPE